MSMQDSQQFSEVKVMLLKGEGGRGIASIVKAGTSGALGDVYTITYTDGTKTTYTVENGNGITSIEKTGTSGALTDVYTITFDDGSTETFNVTNGNGITSIAKTGTSGNVDTYTITMTDGTEYTFTVTNAEQAGHTIKDEGVPMTDRAALDFVDFDLTDDSVNDETKIAPHRLSSAEMSEICSPLPDAPTVVGNVRMSKLWENSSPASDMASGSITLSSGDYTMLLIEFMFYKGQQRSSVIVNKGENALLCHASTNNGYRMIGYTDDTHLSVGGGFQVNTYGSTATANNGYEVPLRIYGIKLL